MVPLEKTSPIIIKKYPNRRLYNTQTSTYIKLEDLAQMIKRDEEFKVVDVKTNEDITKLTMAQIILDQESKCYEMLPDELIKTIIKIYDNPMNHFFINYFTEAAKSFNKMHSSREIFEQTSNFSKDLEKITENNFKMFNDIFFGAFGINTPPTKSKKNKKF